MFCENCGHDTSEAFVALADYCPNCKTTPFPEVTYEVARLDEGAERWAFKRNGQVVHTFRQKRSAHKAVEMAAFFLGHLGHESSTVKWYVHCVNREVA
jgi:hypothetical protein